MTRKNKRKAQVESPVFKQLYLFPPGVMDELKRKAAERGCKEREKGGRDE